MVCEECNSPETYNDSDEDGRGYWHCMECGHWTFDEDEDEPYPDSDRQHVDITTANGNKAFATLSKDATPEDIKLVENIVDEVVQCLRETVEESEENKHD